jgi:hypothetical protein
MSWIRRVSRKGRFEERGKEEASEWDDGSDSGDGVTADSDGDGDYGEAQGESYMWTWDLRRLELDLFVP